MIDGNFTADQLAMRRPDDDVHLTDGTGFMTQDERYQSHLKVAIEIKEVCARHYEKFVVDSYILEKNLP